MVLAEKAFQGAPGKKNGTGTPGTGNRRFFAPVYSSPGKSEIGTFTAKALFIRSSVDSAGPAA
jgi:hypothetical protein